MLKEMRSSPEKENSPGQKIRSECVAAIAELAEAKDMFDNNLKGGKRSRRKESKLTNEVAKAQATLLDADNEDNKE